MTFSRMPIIQNTLNIIRIQTRPSQIPFKNILATMARISGQLQDAFQIDKFL
jgi:hypothetical protein